MTKCFFVIWRIVSTFAAIKKMYIAMFEQYPSIPII